MKVAGANQACLDEAIAAGLALNFVARQRRCRAWSIATLEARILTPNRHRQLKLYFNEHGDTAALVTWAWLTPQVLDRVCKDSSYVLHPTEWREGEHLCIVDLVAADGMPARVLDDLMTQQFATVGRAHWLYGRGAIRKAVLFKREPAAQPT